MGVIEKARTYAIKWHGSQMYGDETYSAGHLAKVAMLVESLGGDPQTIATAWLHDIIEDTLCPTEDLYEQFGRQIGDAVTALTKTSNDDYAWYLHQLKMNRIAIIVKFCDARVNLRKTESEIFSGILDDEGLGRANARVKRYTGVIQQLFPLIYFK